jgi:hypothetical protein
MTARLRHYPPFVSMDVPIFHPHYLGAFANEQESTEALKDGGCEDSMFDGNADTAE